MNGAVPEKTHVRVQLRFKRGDKTSKGNLSIKDGMLIDAAWDTLHGAAVLDNAAKQKYTPRMAQLVEYDVPVDDWPEHEALLREAMSAKEVFNPDGSPNQTEWRARKMLVNAFQLESQYGVKKFEETWGSFAPAPVLKVDDYRTFLLCLKSSDTLNPTRFDMNQVASGTYTVGPAAGDDYATWALAFADIAGGGLTGDLTFNQTGDVTEVAAATITENLAGHTFTCSIADGNWHHGNFTRGHATNITVNGHCFNFEMEGPGNVELSRLRFVRTVAGGAIWNTQVLITAVTTGCTMVIHHVLFDGGGLRGAGLGLSDPDVITQCYSCEFTDFPDSTAACIVGAAGAHANTRVENCTFEGSTVGFNANNSTIRVRRLACYANTTDMSLLGNATGDRCQSDDATAADGNWAAGTNNQINGNPAVDFDSVDDLHPKFLRPVDGGVLELAAGGTYLAANTTDISGRPWATYGNWIGARAHPGPVAEPDWTDITNYVNNSQYGIAYRKFFEGTHWDTLNHPLVLTEAELSAAQETFFFTTNPPAADGSDIVVVAHTAAGAVECATEVVGINLGAGTFTIWARYPDLDDEYGDVLADAIFSIQWGGDGRTLASTAVYDSNYNSGDDHHGFWHLENGESGVAVDAAGHYDLTEAGTVVDAAAQVDNGADFEAGDTADSLVNAGAGNFEYSILYDVLLWLNPEAPNGNQCVIGRFDAGANRGWCLYREAAGTYLLYQMHDGVNYVAGRIPAISTGALHFIVLHFFGTGTVAGMSVEVDGVIQTVTAVTDNLLGNTILSTADFVIGSSDALAVWFDGIADEARAITHVQMNMTVADGRTHYNNEYTNTDNGVFDWGENIGENPGAPVVPAGGIRQRQYVFRMAQISCRP